MMKNISNRIAEFRGARGLSAAVLAVKIGVSRQTIYAIEAGTYIPNTEVALKLARELEVSVEALFSLDTEPPPRHPEPVHSDLLSPTAPSKGQAVRVCRMPDSRLVSVPSHALPYFLPDADGIIANDARLGRPAELAVLTGEEDFVKRIVLAGCDPAIGLLAREVQRLSGVEIVSAPASSRLALTWLKQGKVHIAGTHLKDYKTGEFNTPVLRREFPDDDLTVVTFAVWEEGFVTAPGNPRSIAGIADLARSRRKKTTFSNREPGSGSRALLDNLLTYAGIPTGQVDGYDRVSSGHLAAAHAVQSGQADCCLATRSAAQAFGLHFIPIQSERYDFAIPKNSLQLPAIQTFLDVLQKGALRRKLEMFAGYETSQTGQTRNASSTST